MQDIIDYDSFMANKEIVFNENINSYNQGIAFLIESKASIISYITTEIFSFNNVDLFIRDADNNYIVMIPIKKECDIIDNINITSEYDIKMQFQINNNVYNYDDIKEIILIAAPYTEIKLKLLFSKKPNMDDIIELKYKCYLLDIEDRNMLQNKYVNTKSNKYRNGCIYPV